MDELRAAMDKALEAVGGQPAVAGHLRRAVALARFEAHEDGGPFRNGPLSPGVPQPPQGPMFPVSVHPALEELQHQLVWAADCAEYSDATSNARQYLQAAGHVDLAARALLGPDGLERWPPVLVRDLAAATGLDLADFVPAMGMLPPNHAGVSASFRWDMHHENPVSDPEDLGRRELISWSAGTLSFAPPERPPPPPLGDRLEQVTTPEELAALAPVSAIELATALGVPDAFARTVDVHMSSWRLTTPDGPPTFRGWTVLASLYGTPTGGDLDIFIPASRAAALGPQDVVSDLRAE